VHHVGILYGQFMMHGQRNTKFMLMFLLKKMKLSYLLYLVTRTMFSIMEKATLKPDFQ